MSFAADITWRLQNLHLQAELVATQVRFDDDARVRAGDLTTPDHLKWGFYVLLAYELPFWNLQPYYLVERTDFGHQRYPDFTEYWAMTGGLRVRFLPNVVLKLQYQYGDLQSEVLGTTGLVQAQLALAF